MKRIYKQEKKITKLPENKKKKKRKEETLSTGSAMQTAFKKHRANER